jgi:hypothetical protein
MQYVHVDVGSRPMLNASRASLLAQQHWHPPCVVLACSAVPHLEKSLAHTLPLVALMHIEVQHTQWLNLNNSAVGLQA